MVQMKQTPCWERSTQPRRPEACEGFTLLELLLVMALLILFVGGLGFYQLQSTGRSRLDAAARQVGFILLGAQTHAQSAGIATRVLVEFDPTHPEFLRSLQVVQWQDGQWVARGGSRVLPSGVGVVPSDGQWLGPEWTSESVSIFSRQGERVVLDPDGWGAREFVYIEFRADGLPDVWGVQDYWAEDVEAVGMELQITLSPYTLGAEHGLQFLHPSRSRELRISARGDAWIQSGGR